MRSVRRLSLGAVLALTVLTSAGMATAASPITEYPLPVASQGPTGITAGPDGNLWFAQTATNALGIVSPSGTITTYGGLYGPAQDVVEGPDGKLWFTEPNADKIGTLALPGRTLTEFTVPTKGAKPTDITVGPGGDLWFTETGGTGAIARITTAGTITEYTTGLSHGAGPQGITPGPDGDIWFTETGGSGAIGKLDPNTGTITEYTAGLTVGRPTAIVAGPDGNLWFTEADSTGAIAKITTGGTITEYTSGLTPRSQPEGITAGPDGNMWFTEAGNPGQIGDITPAGVITEVATPTSAAAPDTITALGGELWFTEPGAGGKIGSYALGAGGSSGGSGTGAGAPSATTGDASHITRTTAKLAGTTDATSEPVSYHFDWGTTSAYGHSTDSRDVPVGWLNSHLPLTQELNQLTPGTIYHYRLVVTECGGCASGTSYGADVSFLTAGTPPPPVQGRTATTGVLAGHVLIKVPGSRREEPLHGGDVPVGSVIDASQGKVRIGTALGHGRIQTATLWGGSFTVAQRHGQGMTTFTVPGLACPTLKAHRAAVFGTEITARHRPRRHRAPSLRLWATDHNGQYSTQGYNSVATVRGTVWETIETCQGTRTYVARGLVSVRDLRRHRTVLVRAGHSILVRR